MIASVLVMVACLTPPVDVPIAVGFVRPSCEFCAGHRGVEYHPPPAVPVRAVASGVVTFAGRVAGTLYVVVGQPDGVRATYGMLATRVVGRGAAITAGQVVGYSSARLYFGLRDAHDRALDPTSMLGRWVGRPRLIPDDGTSPRRKPPPRLACPATNSGR